MFRPGAERLSLAVSASPKVVYKIRRPIWFWRSLAILLFAAWFVLMSIFGWVTVEEVSRGNGFWPVAGVIYVVAVVLLVFPLFLWSWVRRPIEHNWLRHPNNYHHRTIQLRRAKYTGLFFTVILTISLAGSSAADTGLWIFGTFLFFWVGLFSLMLLSAIFVFVIFRRIS